MWKCIGAHAQINKLTVFKHTPAHRQAKAGSEIKEEIPIGAEGYWSLNKKIDIVCWPYISLLALFVFLILI